jgi:hypothetical protein
MAKIVLDQVDGNIDIRSFSAVATALAKVLGDEVYIRKSVTIESSDAVIKSLETVLAGVKSKSHSPKVPSKAV